MNPGAHAPIDCLARPLSVFALLFSAASCSPGQQAMLDDLLTFLVAKLPP